MVLRNYALSGYGETLLKYMSIEKITPAGAKKIIKAALEERGLPFEKLTARTVDFTDLAGAKCVFVKIHGWNPDPRWEELKAVARMHGFRLQSDLAIQGRSSMG